MNFLENREFKMTDDNFLAIRELVYRSAGIVLGDHKREMVYSRLSRRLRHLKQTNFDQYLSYLETHEKEEFTHFINSITTNLTSFFRENHHFEFLKKTVIPELLAKRGQGNKIRVWSAGCSTGEEPYSISMTMAKSFSGMNWDFKILATDLDSNVLAKAQAGIYAESNVTSLPDDIKSSGFVRNKEGNSYKIKSEFQKPIHFKRLNLLEPWPMKGAFDVIFCRNVVIYFDTETKNSLMERYAQMLKPGGYLFLGHSESMSRHITAYDAMGHTIYRRKGF